MSVVASRYNLLEKDAREALAAGEPERFQYRAEGGAYLNLRGLSLEPLEDIDEVTIAKLAGSCAAWRLPPLTRPSQDIRAGRRRRPSRC